MGRVIETNRLADVICQHNQDGTMIPLKIRILDEDGERQTYVVRAYKDLTVYGNSGKTELVTTKNHIWTFECKILVFHQEKRIRMTYNAYENSWRILEVR